MLHLVARLNVSRLVVEVVGVGGWGYNRRLRLSASSSKHWIKGKRVKEWVSSGKRSLGLRSLKRL